MAYSWRPPPPQPHPSQGDCCPICYYPHFPFCHPPPPPYPPNPILQYQPHPGHFYHRQPPLAPPQLAFDPFLDHQSAPPMHPHHRPYMDRYEALPLPSNQGVSFNSNPYGSLNSKDNFVQCNAGTKRKHYDDSSESCAKSARFSVDDERRLKLIHDHGGPTDHDPGSRRDYDKIEDHVKGTIEFPDFGHGDRNQGQYELQQVDKNLRKRNDHGFNDGPAYNYKNLDPRRNIMQHEQSASLGCTLENSSNGPLSDFYLKQNQFGSRRQAAASENTPLHDSPSPLLAGIHVSSSPPPRTTPSLFPIHADASVYMPNYLPGTDAAQAYYHAIGNSKPPAGFAIESFHYASPRIGPGESEQYPARHLSSDKPNIVDAIHILKHPHRSAQPAHIAIILRGLPGSGKSYLAKMLRDLEVENGGNAPRIHSIDDYFMTEVEKVDESEVSRSAGSTKGKKSVRRKVIEYCYEPEMEEAYRSSMLKAFKKTLDEGVFSLVIVDDRNLRVADFAQFWATAKRSGYEVYLLEAPYTDPVGCAARNVHGFTLSEIQKWTDEWEEAPSMYLKLDIKSLIHGDDLEHGAIQEVDMDMEDGDASAEPSTSEQGNTESAVVPPMELCSDGHSKSVLSWDDDESEHAISLVKDIGKSKWSTDLDEDDVQIYENNCKKSNGSGSIQSSRKEGKTVRWGDQAAKAGFSIGAKKAANVSLVIGPGAGYNLKSNPIAEGEENMTSSDGWQTKRRQGVFQEQLRAEQESFKAVLDKRRQRVGGFVADEE